MRHVHRTHRVNLDWFYKVFTNSSYRCRLRYVSTKHQIADMHVKTITKAYIWVHLSKLAQLDKTPFVRVALAGTSQRRAKSVCIRVRSFCTMSSGFAATDSAIPSPGVSVFRCPACSNVETDNAKLKWKISIGFPIFLCCATCTGWQEVAWDSTSCWHRNTAYYLGFIAYRGFIAECWPSYSYCRRSLAYGSWGCRRRTN